MLCTLSDGKHNTNSARNSVQLRMYYIHIIPPPVPSSSPPPSRRQGLLLAEDEDVRQILRFWISRAINFAVVIMPFLLRAAVSKYPWQKSFSERNGSCIFLLYNNCVCLPAVNVQHASFSVEHSPHMHSPEKKQTKGNENNTANLNEYAQKVHLPFVPTYGLTTIICNYLLFLLVLRIEHAPLPNILLNPKPRPGSIPTPSMLGLSPLPIPGSVLLPPVAIPELGLETRHPPRNGDLSVWSRRRVAAGVASQLLILDGCCVSINSFF